MPALFEHFGLFWTDISEFGAAIIIFKHNKSKFKFLVFYVKPILKMKFGAEIIFAMMFVQSLCKTF